MSYFCVDNIKMLLLLLNTVDKSINNKSKK